MFGKDKNAKKGAAEEAPKGRIGLLFSTKRQIFVLCFMIFFCALDVSLLGLISEQLQKYGNDWTSYPDGRFYHAIGLGLFATIFGLLFGMFHAWLSHFLMLFCMFASGVFFGTVAGILYYTPFGHGLQCGNPVDRFPAKYQPFVSECSRITAISGLSWAMFALSVIGFFFFFFDKFSIVSHRDHIYIPYEAPVKPVKIHHDEESAPNAEW